MSFRSFALSALALSAAAAAQAQSSYNLYGVIDLSLGSMQISGLSTSADNKRTTKVEPNAMTTSFIGLKGLEDLGGGMKAGFVLESFLRPDTGAQGRFDNDRFWGRAANVFLDSGYGKLTIGRQGNLLFGQVASFNPFGGAFGLSPAVRLTFGRWGNDRGDSGWANAVTYNTPKFGGASFAVSWQPGEDPDKGERSSYAVSGSYVAGPFAVGGAWQTLGAAEPPKGDFLEGQRQTFGLLSSSYDFGVAKLFAQYGKISNSGFSTTARIDTNLYQLGASVPLSSAGKVLVSYGQSSEKPVEGGTTPKTKHTIVSVGYDHLLSKRTDIYAVVMHDKEKLANFRSGTSYVLGLRHAF